MFQNLFIYIIGIIPLIVIDRHFEVPKVFVFLLLGFLVGVFWIYKYFLSSTKITFQKKDYWYLSWLGVLVIASIFAYDPKTSFLGGSYRHEGLIFFLTLFLIGKTVSYLSNKNKLYLKKVVTATILIESLIVILQFLTGNLYFGKPLGTIGEASAIAGFLTLGTYFLIETLPKIWSLILSIPIALTFSRSGVLSYVTFLFISLFKQVKPLFFVPLVALSIYYFTLIHSLKTPSIFENRPLFWKIGVEAFLQKPIFGYGLESQEKIYEDSFERYEIKLENLIIDRSHNLFLDLGLWSGSVGLIFFMGWLFWEYKGLITQNKKAVFFAFLIYSFFQPLSVVHWTLLIVLFNI